MKQPLTVASKDSAHFVGNYERKEKNIPSGSLSDTDVQEAVPFHTYNISFS